MNAILTNECSLHYNSGSGIPNLDHKTITREVDYMPELKKLTMNITIDTTEFDEAVKDLKNQIDTTKDIKLALKLLRLATIKVIIGKNRKIDEYQLNRYLIHIIAFGVNSNKRRHRTIERYKENPWRRK